MGGNDEMRYQLQPKKTKLKPFIQQQKTFYLPFITNKTERISFKSGCAVRVAKQLKGDWFIVLSKQLWHNTTLYCC